MPKNWLLALLGVLYLVNAPLQIQSAQPLFSIFTQPSPKCHDSHSSIKATKSSSRNLRDGPNKQTNATSIRWLWESTHAPRRPYFISWYVCKLPCGCILAWEDETKPTRHIIDFSSRRLRYLLIWGLSEVIRAIVPADFPSIEARPGPLFEPAGWLTPTACVLGRPAAI